MNDRDNTCTKAETCGLDICHGEGVCRAYQNIKQKLRNQNIITLCHDVVKSEAEGISVEPVSRCPLSVVYLEDCVQGLKRFSDNYFDLAIVDPPYGIDVAASGKVGGNNCGKAKDYGAKDWDKQAPNEEYFSQLRRVSKNQIVWGANHFISKLPFDSSCWLVWDKDNSGNFADCELAWTSFDTAVRKFMWRWNGMLQQNMKNKEERIHPTQKPVALYEWILQNYASEGYLILDTHVGSGSSRIACHKAGKQFVGFEIDKDYYEAQEKRFKDFVSQLRMF